MALLSLVITCIAVYVVYTILHSYASKRAFDAFARAHGCREPLDLSGLFPHGWARMKKLIQLDQKGEDILDLLGEDLASAHTVKVQEFDFTTSYITDQPENVRAILATQFNDFEIGAQRHDQFKPMVGRSIFSSDGAAWQHSRALFRPAFARDNVNHLDSTDEAVDDLLMAIGSSDSEGWTPVAEMVPLLRSFTIDTASEFLFGESLKSQLAEVRKRDPEGLAGQPQDAVFQSYSDAMSLLMVTISRRLRYMSFYWLVDGLEFRRAKKTVDRFIGNYVKEAVRSAKSPEKQGGKRQSLLENLALQTQDETDLLNQILSLLAAGRDTPSGLLAWCLAELSVRPELYATLRQVVARDVPVDREITFASLKQCRYLQHFLNEVLRIHAVFPLGMRVAAKDTTLPLGGGPDEKSPVAIRKGQAVLYSLHHMHRRRDLWGEDADELKVERWQGKIPAWQYVPFSGGPRICIAQQFSLIEVSYCLVRILREFDRIEPADWEDMKKLKRGLGIAMAPANEVPLRFHRDQS